jgi:acid stress chaperone HdeB
VTPQTAITMGARIVTRLKSIAAGLLFCLVTALSAGAQVTIDASKITCKDFLTSTIADPDLIAYWLSGYYNGKRGNTVLDVNSLHDYVHQVEDYCVHNQDMMVMKAAETFLGVSK